MLNDAETTLDYLNFKIVADPVAQMIIQGGDKPVSIGVSGNWGAGKSSMVGMIADSLKSTKEAHKYIFLDFNAWLYQGYEDARIALLQQVADKLEDEAKSNCSVADKVKDFLSRIKWVKLALAATPSVLRMATGAILGDSLGALNVALEGLRSKAEDFHQEDLKEFFDANAPILTELRGFEKREQEWSMPREISALRKSFSDALEALGKRLVIVVDDLDRCLPSTALSTLEAMRLLLFVDRTIFVIAADEAMIRQAVRSRYGDDGLDEDRVTSYFDKLIQIPVRVPRPGSNEVKCYVMSLLSDMAVQTQEISREECDLAQNELRKLLKSSWRGKVTARAISAAFGESVSKVLNYIDIADQVAGIMTSSQSIGGNPRLIKRFLNNLLIRKAVADSQEMSLDFGAMVKLHLCERCAPSGAFDELARLVAMSDDGKVAEIAALERCIKDKTELPELPEKWTKEFAREWCALSPQLSDVDLRPYIYLSQEDKKRFVPAKDLSPEGRVAMSCLTEVKKYRPQILREIQKVETGELSEIFEVMKERVRTSQFDGVTLIQLMHIPLANSDYQQPYIDFMKTVKRDKVSSNIIPILNEQTWAAPLIESWQEGTDRLAKQMQAFKK